MKCTSGKASLVDGLSVDLRKDWRSPFSIYGNTIKGTMSSAKQMPSSPSTLGWSKSSISADLVTNSSISSCDETSVEALHCNLNMATKWICQYFSLFFTNLVVVIKCTWCCIHPHNVKEVVVWDQLLMLSLHLYRWINSLFSVLTATSLDNVGSNLSFPLYTFPNVPK